jgi:hypothetical protein
MGPLESRVENAASSSPLLRARGVDRIISVTFY